MKSMPDASFMECPTFPQCNLVVYKWIEYFGFHMWYVLWLEGTCTPDIDQTRRDISRI